jgi:hypothetical protein
MERPDLVDEVVTRMVFLVKHLRKVKDRVLAEYELAEFEYSTLRALAARDGRAAPRLRSTADGRR